MITRHALLLSLLVPLSGCSFLSSEAQNGVNEGIDHAAQREVQNQQPQPTPPPTVAAQPTQPPPSGNYGPMMARAYSQMVFALAFGPGAIAKGADYKPGQYTRWTVSQGHGSFERAFLFNDSAGNGWWQFKMSNGDGKDAIYEALVTPDHTRILKLKAKMPGDSSAQDLPVDDSMQFRGASYDMSSGAKDMGVETVSVPAGSFSAHHFHFDDPQGRGSGDQWQADSVPGKVVKTSGSNNQGRGGEMVLTAFGSDAKSELGVTP